MRADLIFSRDSWESYYDISWALLVAAKEEFEGLYEHSVMVTLEFLLGDYLHALLA